MFRFNELGSGSATTRGREQAHPERRAYDAVARNRLSRHLSHAATKTGANVRTIGTNLANMIVFGPYSQKKAWFVSTVFLEDREFGFLNTPYRPTSRPNQSFTLSPQNAASMKTRNKRGQISGHLVARWRRHKEQRIPR